MPQSATAASSASVAAAANVPRPPLAPASDTFNAGWVVPNPIREAVQVVLDDGLPVPPQLRIMEAVAQNDVEELARIVEVEGVEADAVRTGCLVMCGLD